MKEYTRNIFNLITFQITIILLLVSCGNRETDNLSNTITFWHFWSEPYQRVVIDSLVKEFEKLNKCKVVTGELSWNDGKTKLFAAFNSKTAPDVLELGSDWVAQFSSAEVLYELNSEYFEIDKFIDYSLEPSFWDDKLYAIPWIIDTRVLFYNKDLLEQAGLEQNEPLLYSQLLEEAEKINELPGVYGFGANSSDPHRLYKKIVTFFWSNQGNVLNKAAEPVINSKENIEALRMYVRLAQNGLLETQRQIDAAFTQGKIGFWLSGAWLLTKIENENPQLNFAVSLVPGFNGKPGISFTGGEYLAVSKDTKNKELAQKFVKFMTDGKNSIEFCKRINEAGFPADKNYFNDPFYENKPYRQIFAQQLMSAKMTPVHPKWLEIEEIIEIAAVESLYGRKSPKESLDEAQKKLLDLLK